MAGQLRVGAKSRVHVLYRYRFVVSRGRETPKSDSAEAGHYRRRGLRVLNAARGMHQTTWCSEAQSANLLGEKVPVSCARSRYTLFLGELRPYPIAMQMTCINTNSGLSGYRLVLVSQASIDGGVPQAIHSSRWDFVANAR